MSNFRQVDRQTVFLLPPSVDEWLAEGHLARFVVEVIDQLDLSNRGFAFLVSIRGLLAQSPPQPILDAEWRQVASIMTQARKVRFFAAWRAEEAAAAITVSPDSFVLVSSTVFSDP